MARKAKAKAVPEADARISVVPKPLVAQQAMTIEVDGLPPDTSATVSVEPEWKGRTHPTRTDRWGHVQTTIIPVAGKHRVVVEAGGSKAVSDFDVAQE